MGPRQMTINPYTPPKSHMVSASDPDLRRPKVGGERPRMLGCGHAIVFAALWLPYTALVFFVVSRGLDRATERLDVIASTTIASVSGPMVGAISRGCQDCCLRFSLSLLAYCGPALMLAVAAQWVWRPRHWFFRAVRLLLWAAGWVVWFGGGIVSFGHALS
jgi:hypothetical protein